MAEDSVDKNAEKPVRANTLERRYWARMGWRPDFKEPTPLPDFLYHKTSPINSEAILKEGLLAKRHLDSDPSILVVFLGDKEPEKKSSKRDATVKVKPGSLDPNWISTGNDSDSTWGNVWMHAGNIIPEQIVSIDDPDKGVLLGKGTTVEKPKT